jgi:predicted lysophospholipase L1 biosynthesis ABC-type transport system permease subunit
MTAGRLWPGQNPIGKRFRQGGDDSPLMEVLGVAGDVSGASMAARPTMTVYVPYWQKLWGNPTLVLKTPMSLGAAAGEIRTVIHQLDPEMPVSAFRTMQDVIDTSLAQRRFQMDLVLLFAVTALLLATLGIYGVVSYSVAQRANEIGIRMTLGAQRSTISGMVLRDGLRPVMFGLVAADVTSVAIRRGLASLLYGVKVIDPITIVGVIVVLSAMSAAAVLWPAWRATKVDASVALRYE